MVQLLLLCLCLVSACVNGQLLDRSTDPNLTPLVVHARGIACSSWHGGAGPPPGIGRDCIFHQAIGSSHPGPWLGAVDAVTAACSPIKGLTAAVGNLQEIYGLLTLTNEGYGNIGFARPNSTSGVHGFHVKHDDTISLAAERLKADWPPAWVENNGADGLLGWTAVELHGTTTRVQELLQVFSPDSGQVTATLANVTTTLPSGNSSYVPRFGFEHAVRVDREDRVLYTLNKDRGIDAYDFEAKTTLPSLPSTQGKEFFCLYIDPGWPALGAILATSPTDYELVRIDMDSGATTTLARWSHDVFPGPARNMLRHEPDGAPMCKFDDASGRLVMLLVQRDARALPGWDLESLYIGVLPTYDCEVSGHCAWNTTTKLAFPFTAPTPLGNRTWRAMEPDFGFLEI